MIKRRSQLHVAHEIQPQHENHESTVADLSPADTAEYIAALLSSLQAIALQARFPLLSDLLSVAEEEAKLHFHA